MWNNAKHRFLMLFSPSYVLAFRLELAFAELRAYVQECNHRGLDRRKMANLIGGVRSLDLCQELKIAEVLSGQESQNWDVWEMAFALDPTARTRCADLLMEQAREHLKMCGCGDRATWARNRLWRAKRWYQEAGAMTPELFDEISVGLAKTAWVIGGPLFVDPDPDPSVMTLRSFLCGS